MQLIRTDVVFSRITLVSCFCAENELSGKVPENMPKTISHQKIPGARRGDRGEAWGAQTHPRDGPTDPAPGGGLATPGSSSASLHAYKLPSDLKTEGGYLVFQKRVPLRRHHQKPRFGSRNSVLAPCWDEEFGEDHRHRHHQR